MPAKLPQEIEWLGLRIRVPDDYEIARHSLACAAGSLTFVDRRRQRLQVFWSSPKSEPDFERMLSDERSRMKEQNPKAKVATLGGLGRFRAVRSEAESGEILTRAATWHKGTGRLLEVVIATQRDVAADAGLPAALLSEMRIHCRAEEARRWRAFGLWMLVPESFRATKVDAKAGDVTFHFAHYDPETDRTGGRLARVRRLGMAGAWYSGDPESLVRHQNKRVSFESFESFDQGGHRVTQALGIERGPPARRFFRRHRLRRARLWYCDAANSLLLTTTSAPARKELQPDSFAVRCCEQSPDVTSLVDGG